MNSYTETVTDSKQERDRQRVKKDEKSDAEFFNQITTTMQNLQRDLDRITARVRSLEGRALQALAPPLVSALYGRIYLLLLHVITKLCILFLEATYNSFVSKMVASTRMFTTIIYYINFVAVYSTIFYFSYTSLSSAKTVI